LRADRLPGWAKAGGTMREKPEIVWERYQSLEKEFLNFLEYVPFSPKHYDVWSYPLVNLFIYVGSSVDSFFKNAIYWESVNDYPKIDEIRADDQHSMKGYREIFQTRYKISNKQIFELRNYSAIYPFRDWSEQRTPDWWRRYTDIKQDRFRNKEQATLKATIDASRAIFTFHNPSRDAFNDHRLQFHAYSTYR